MLRFTLVRLGQAILVLFVVATVVFLLSRASGNVAELVAPPDAPPETVQQIETEPRPRQAADQPVRRLHEGPAHGDLGQSFAYRHRRAEPHRRRPPEHASSSGVCAFAFAAVFGIAIGVSLGDETGRLDRPRRQGPGASPASRCRRSGSASCWCCSSRCGSTGSRRSGREGGSTSCCRRSPSARYSLASLTRLTRSAVLEVHAQGPHAVRAGQRACRRRRLVVHTLRNASLPIVTLAGILLGTLFSAP